MDAEVLITGLGELSRSAVREFGVDAMLQRLCEVASAGIGADGAGVVASAEPGTRFVHAVGVRGARTAERLQELLGQGPCIEAMATGTPVRVQDTGQEGRWPLWAGRVSGSGIGSVLAVPLMIRDRCWGALDLYRAQPGPWSDRDVAGAVLLAEVAASYIVMALDRQTAASVRVDLETQTLTDQLTGLANRTLLMDRLEHAIAVAVRARRAVAVMFIDLDRFKQINDTFGHSTGDALLREVAHRMRSTLRRGDTLARLSGDEFVLLCEDLTLDPVRQLAEINRIAVRLRHALAAPVGVGTTSITVSASIGASVAAGPVEVAELLAEADTAMYAAKTDRTVPVVIHDPARSLLGPAHRQLQHDMPQALERGQLSLDYQPIIDPATGRFDTVEALLRWDHPDQGRVGADRFILLADGLGLLPAMGRWVVTEAVHQLGEWDALLGPTAAVRTVFCNFTPRELVDPQLGLAIRAALDRSGFPADRLGLEVLEAAFADPLLAPVLASYHQLGHPVAIDDFGVGYSSLSRLITLPVDYAKIDRSLVAGLPTDDRSRAVIDAIRILSRNLGLTVIAEGVETTDQAQYLIRAGCQRLQGFLYHHPMTGDQITLTAAAAAAGAP